MASKVMITTIDNPYDPLKEFDEWYRFDEEKGYHTCGYLARIAATSYEISDADYEDEIENAIDDIIKYNPLKIYKKVEY